MNEPAYPFRNTIDHLTFTVESVSSDRVVNIPVLSSNSNPDKVDKQPENVVDLLLTHHSTVQAFVDKNVQQARKNLESADIFKPRCEQ